MQARTARLFAKPARRAADVPAGPVAMVFAIVFAGTLAALLIP